MTSVMATYQNEIKEVETVDLTGDELVHETKTIVRQIPVVNLEEKCEDAEKFPIDKEVHICELCQQKAFKYRCPACNTKTCSLLCSQKHKQKYQCSGERDKSAFVSRSNFNNFHLLSDYRFLEEAARIADNAKRDYKAKPNIHLGKQSKFLRKAALRNGVSLFRMAKGMQRWKENKSRYFIKENIIFWTVKFIFKDIDEEIITKCSENEVFENILAPYIVKEQCNIDNLKKYSSYITEKNIHLIFRHELKPGENNKRYCLINLKDSLKCALTGKSVLEYPIFLVVLPTTSRELLEELFTKSVTVSIDQSDDDEVGNDENEIHTT